MAQTPNGGSNFNQYTTTALNRWSVADKQLPGKKSWIGRDLGLRMDELLIICSGG